MATGAAAGLREAPLDRAYFELLERITLTASSSAANASSEHRVSSSNGVALHADHAKARRAAQLELIERDRILRSWYGGSRPRQIEHERAWPRCVEHYYRVRAYRFDSGLDLDGELVEVAGVVAFPRTPDAPLSLGFAARESLDETLQAAGRELLQQIAFGWGEPVPATCPDPAPTPEFHLDFYAYPGNHDRLGAWLSGEHEGRGPELPEATGMCQFTDITPPWMGGGLSVVRAEHRSAVPLVFGRGHPWFRELPEFMQVQPIA